MKIWLIHTLLALVLWGFWAFFPKLATKYIDPKSVLVFQGIGFVLVGFVVLVGMRFQPETRLPGVIYALLTGIFAAAGMIFFLAAIKNGKVSTIVPITALYPVLSILLAFFILREPITVKQLIGIGFAFIAIYLLSS